MPESLAPRRRPFFRIQFEPNEGCGIYAVFDRMPTPNEVLYAFSLGEAQGRINLGSSAQFESLCLESLPEPPVIAEFSTTYYFQLPIGRLVVTREYVNLTDIESR
jgi:hypothetical protein